MKLLQRGVALALLTTFTLASEAALAYEQDKTYKITVLHTNDHHGHFWRNEYGEYGLITRSPYYASRKSGQSSRYFLPISTRKVPASACLNHGRCLSVRI